MLLTFWHVGLSAGSCSPPPPTFFSPFGVAGGGHIRSPSTAAHSSQALLRHSGLTKGAGRRCPPSHPCPSLPTGGGPSPSRSAQPARLRGPLWKLGAFRLSPSSSPPSLQKGSAGTQWAAPAAGSVAFGLHWRSHRGQENSERIWGSSCRKESARAAGRSGHCPPARLPASLALSFSCKPTQFRKARSDPSRFRSPRPGSLPLH